MLSQLPLAPSSRVPLALSALLLLSLACACGGTRTVVIQTERPAAVIADGQRVCEASPCRWTFSRETCGLFDSSKGYVRFDAEVRDPASGTRTYNSPMFRLCALKPNEQITIPMPEAAYTRRVESQ